MAKRLTVREVERFGPGRYSDGTGVGLMIWVSKTGAKTWVQRITIGGKRKDIGLGSFPLVSLAAARDRAIENKRAVQQGRDPLAEKRRARFEAAKRRTFAQAAEQVRDELMPTWKSQKEAAAFLSSLRRHVFPQIGDMDIASITAGDIRRLVLACRAKAPNTSMKVQHRIYAVFKWAVAEGLRGDNPATGDALALPKLEKQTRSNLALPYQQVSGAMEKIADSKARATTKLGLEFLILTAGRSGEVRGAHWDEIDLDRAEWSIPADRMKMRRPHRVPLSDRAMQVLRKAQQCKDGSGLVFPSATGKQMSDMTMSKLVRALGIQSTVHGFRASFRTWAQEQTDVPGEVAEAALAHVKADKVEAAYARSDLFEKRRRLMEQWAAFLSSQSGC